MNANELRIGNLTYKIDRSKEIHMPSGIVFVICGVGIFDSEILMHGQNPAQHEFKKVSNWDLSPIPLTPEWLIKLGFKKSEYINSELSLHVEECFCLTFNENNSGGISISAGAYAEDGSLLTQIKYVHQIQNLYFSLTGIELKIKS